MPFQRRVLVTVAFVVVFASGYVTGQRQPPTANVGQSEQALRSLDLTGEMETTVGRPLRMRKITLQPGGVLGIHNHVDRPAVTYLLQGQMTYRQAGKPDSRCQPRRRLRRGPRHDALGGEHRQGTRGLDRGGHSKAVAEF